MSSTEDQSNSLATSVQQPTTTPTIAGAVSAPATTHPQSVAATGVLQMEQEFKTIRLPEGCDDAEQVPAYNKETDPPLQRFDLGNARRFEWRYAGKFIYTKATKWLVYENGRWRIDKTKQAEQAMLRTLNLIVQEADLVEGDDDKAKEAREAIYAWARACERLALFTVLHNPRPLPRVILYNEAL